MALKVALDIETTGLNPWTDRVVTAAFASSSSKLVWDDPFDERHLLTWVNDQFVKYGWRRVVTWNGSEFDLPFLAVRFLLTGIETNLSIAPRFVPEVGYELGKYGKPRYEAAWFGAVSDDIAYEYEAYAKELEIQWSLKPVAKAKGQTPKEFDFSVHTPTGIMQRSVLELDHEEREDYCLSDATATLKLSDELDVSREKAIKRGKAVLLHRDLTIL